MLPLAEMCISQWNFHATYMLVGFEKRQCTIILT